MQYSPQAIPGSPLMKQYLNVIRRRRWVILGVVAACLLLGVVVTILMTPQYTAESVIEISRESDQVTNIEGVESDIGAADQEFYQTQYGLLRSRTLAERVATELKLVDNPEFFEMFGAGDNDDAVFATENERFKPDGRSDRLRQAGRILLENLTIEPTRFSSLVDIRFTSPSARFSRAVANAWAENFIELNLERKVQATSYGREALERQLAEYKDRLDESQRQLVAYASNQAIINLPAAPVGDGTTTQERSIVADDLAALNSALNEAIADRIAAEARYRGAGAAGSSVEALSNSAINNLRQRRAELAGEYGQLMVRFEPGYPAAQAIQSQIDQIDSSIAREEARVSSSVQAAYQQAVAREQALQQRVSALKDDFLDLRRRSIQYNIYQQEVDTTRVLYEGLLQRFKEIGVAGGVGVNNITIVDLAEIPEQPSSPHLLLNLALSVFAGLGLGLAAAFALEQLDEQLKEPSDIPDRLGIPLLGSVPKIADRDNPREALLDRKSELVDAYLTIQTNLGFTTDHGAPRSFAVTSTRAAEGKSTTALALATLLARSGKRVILIDGDMRSPTVHSFAGSHHESGVSNFLAGEDDIAKLTLQLSDFGLSAMTAGPIPPNAAELLTGDRIGQLVNRLLETYDHVVVDAPPLLNLADAPLISRSVEGVVYVTEAHGVLTGQVKSALGRLVAANAHIFGGVLTKLDMRKSQYGYDYGYGYGKKDEELV
ncbi:polysaccharide biosynthesis tyrosine autokinase [Altererythrobacter sp. SALINAS58]|nr:polysaccharide biosynthesis tyrosine autokinase [Alteripontixanthobacter muriae]